MGCLPKCCLLSQESEEIAQIFLMYRLLSVVRGGRCTLTQSNPQLRLRIFCWLRLEQLEFCRLEFCRLEFCRLGESSGHR